MDIRTKAVSLLLLLRLGCGRSSATQLVLIVEKDRAILAADSLILGDHGERVAGCKIHQSGTDNYFYAIQGIATDHK
jgi:hypothetical protein